MSHGKVTDTSIFTCADSDKELFALPWAVIDDLITGYNKENANVPQNPEATNLTIAEIVKKEYALRHIFSEEVAHAHRTGLIRLHDLGMIDRVYCGGQSPAYVAKFGLNLPDALSIAKPAKHALVLIEHIIKFSASLQGHFAGAIGWDAFNMFLAPYIRGLSEEDIYQLAQVLVYEFAQQAVARGGQSNDSATPIIIRRIDSGAITIIPIGTFCHRYLDADGSKSFDHKEYETPSLNRTTGEIEWKPINAVFVHKPASPLKRVNLASGRSVVVTSDHSLFTLNGEGDFIEATATDECDTYLVANRIKTPTTESVYGLDEAWAFGLMIGGGCVLNGKSIFLSSGSEAMAHKFGQFLKDKFGWSGKVIPRNGSFVVSCARGAVEYFSPIGHLSQNKVIPDVFLTAPDNVVLELLAGIIDSDGGISRNRYEISTTSTMLRHQLEFLFNRLGLKYGVRTRDTKSNFDRNYPVHVLLLSAESSKLIDVYRETRQIPVGLTMCNEKHSFSAIKSKVKAEFGVGISNIDYAFRSCGRRLKHHQLMKVVDKLPWVKKYENVLPMICKSVEDYEDCEEFVYDIGVDDNENFILPNGIICHNSIFSDINLYWEIPRHFRNTEAILPGGKTDGSTYAEYEKESKQFFRALMKVYAQGDAMGRPFFFPKPDCHITEAFWQEPDHEEALHLMCIVASKMGSPYFIFDRGEAVKISECCRLQFELNEQDLEECSMPWKMRSAAMQNVTLNLPQLAYWADDYKDFIRRMRRAVYLAAEAHEQKRDYILDLMSTPNSPLTLLKMNLDGETYFKPDRASYLIGILGLHEAVMVLNQKQGLDTESGYDLGFDIIWELSEIVKEARAATGLKLVLEQTPAESTAYGLAKLDMRQFTTAEEYISGTPDMPYYTNSTQFPVDADIGVIERIKLEGNMHPLIDAGAITHIWLGEHQPNPESLGKLVKRIFDLTTNTQVAFSPEFTACNTCGKTHRGLHAACPVCYSEDVDGITRVTGYFSKVKKWNNGKVAELSVRNRQKIPTG